MASSTSEVAGTVGTGLRDYTLALADDALIASHRLTEWVARAPQLEEDVALANIALDLLGQARLLLGYAGSLSDPPQDEDELAHLRDEGDFRNTALVERPNGDFAVTMARLLLLSAYQHELYAALQRSTDATLAAIAAKAVKEVAYHRDHARQWVLRLGDGTAESHRRMQDAVDAEWPWAEELFSGGWIDHRLVDAGIAVDPESLRPALDLARAVVAEATLVAPQAATVDAAGREGRHTEALGDLLAEMQQVARAHPGATW